MNLCEVSKLTAKDRVRGGRRPHPQSLQSHQSLYKLQTQGEKRRVEHPELQLHHPWKKTSRK